MGQNDIYQFLKKNKNKWFSSRDICESLKVGSSSVSTCLKRLRTHKFVFFKQDPKRKNIFLYKVR